MINVRNLSKKYNISHREPYYALRDNMTDFLKNPLSFFAKRLKNPSKEDFWALKDISFDVKQGEVVGIIGRNGAGKTTLLKILSRITYPTKGEIHLRGKVGSLLEVGTGFHPELTGRENIYFNGSILGMKKREIDKKFDAIVDFAGVEKFLDTPVKRFSSGMQVRLAFSVAAHLDPEILLIDEVLAVGDAQFQKKCLGKMHDVSKGGRTILFVSHNMSAIKKLCSRVILLDKGVKIMEEAADKVISFYLGQNLNLKARVEESEIENKLEGLIKKTSPHIRFREISIKDKNGVLRSSFNSDEGIHISVIYDCLTVVNDLRIVVQVVDEDNRPILITQNVDDKNEIDLYQRKPGKYESSFQIPPETFGENRVYISAQLIYPKVEHLILNKILGIDISYQPYNNVQYASFSNVFIRPRFKWKTKSLEVFHE